MQIDFYYAFLTGWSILFIFWATILIFIFLRKPLKSRLTLKLTVQSLIFFILGYVIIISFL